MGHESGIRVATAVNRKMIATGPTKSGPERWLGFNSPTLHHWDLRVPFYYFEFSEYSDNSPRRIIRKLQLFIIVDIHF